ncbi:hypothetical protein DL95DRAFT_386755 [Leptodontidium sp. 2 PMI_412]|nr:hypothetical protein DL95DRAFT_386755 [Leptodontidium sp. 2 PMI_412]
MHRRQFHNPDDEFVCPLPFCNCRFKQLKYLDVHIKGHRGTYRCSVCNEYFMSPFKLRNHKLRHR